ncbi:MAG: N-acetylmuramoyl-L-alanine amidase [Bacteroidaceae bacterium]|nr:N-acetylmuramoyl-L-alanine amidase [Bacteroidaceae bacterium]
MKARNILILAIVLLGILVNNPIFAAEQFVLVIDAGHGGKDPGAVSGKNYEKDVNLAVAQRAGALIAANCKDVKIVYTRKDDRFIELNKRADIANKANADLFISIHCNSADNKSARGTETYLLGSDPKRTNDNLNVAMAENKAILYESDYKTNYAGYDPNSPESMIIFEFMQSEYQKESLRMAQLVQDQLTLYAKRPNRGVKQAGFLVLWKSAMPSILIELGYLSNVDECKYMVSKKGVEELAQSIYRGFKKYLAEVKARQVQIVPAAPAKPEQTKPVAAPAAAKQSTTAKQPATVQQPQQTEQSKTTPANPKPAKQGQTAASSAPIYKVQFLASSSLIKTGDARLQGLSGADYYQDGTLYKYTVGATTNYAEAREKLAEIRKIFADAFLVAFKDGKRISISQAVAETNK